MPTKILIVDSATFKIPVAQWAGAEAIQLNQIKDRLAKAGKEPVLLIGGPFLKGDDQFTALLDESPHPISFLQFSRGEDATRFSPNLAFFANDSRTAGVKSALATGSTIYTDSFMTGALMGIKIDACYEIARKHLKPGAVLGTWAAVQTLIFLGLHSLPDQGTGGNGEKVDLQIGADANKLAFSVQFPLPQEKLNGFRSHQLLDSLRAAGACFEVRYHKTGQRAEILAVFFVGETPEWPVECHTFTPDTPLEDPNTVQGYTFRVLGSDSTAAPVKSGGAFKKKFSEKMKENGPAPAASAPVVVSGGIDGKLAAQVKSLESAINEKDKTIMAQQKQITELKRAAPLDGGTAAAPSPDKALAEKVKSLEGAIVEKDKMIAAQMKAITELKTAATNSAVATGGAAANGKEAALIQKMKEQITKLEDELAEALEREQEQEGQETLPAGVKEQLLRKVKDLEVKLKAAQDERNGKLIALEKQLEDNKKKMKDMSKRITELTEQLRDAA